MQISLRSYLTVGTAAVVGAGAIALTPALPGGAAQTAYLPAPAVAEVSLTGLSFSLPDLVGLLGNLDLGGLLPDVGALPPNLVRAVLAEFIKEAAPVVRVAAGDVLQYVGSAVTGLVIGPDSIPKQLGSAIAAIPTVVQAVVGELRSGEIGAALMLLNQGLFAPITSVGQALTDVAEGVQSFVTAQVSALVSAVPGMLMSAIAAAIGTSADGVLDAIKDALAGFFGGLFPAASAPAAALVAAGPQVVDSEVAADAPVVDAPVVSRAGAVRAAAAAPAAEPSAGADESAVSESAAPQVDPAEVAAPVTRGRAAAARSAVADEVASGPAVATRPEPKLRGGRQNAERPRAAAGSRS